MSKPRDYKREYELYQASEQDKLDRAARNRCRAEMLKKGRVHKGDGMDVDHHNGNPQDCRPSNLRVMTASKNRAKH